METLKIKCPAKINLTLEVLNRREDGYHNIKSIMQMISLYDFLIIKIEHAQGVEINLTGTCVEIPYDSRNLVYKAALLYIETAKLNNIKIDVHIEKHIPVSAGLAGGSTDAAGIIWGLNHIFKKFTDNEINSLCASLGSDLNVCLHGGCVLATSRGEVIQGLPNINSNVTVIKPKHVGISAKEAYTKYSVMSNKTHNNMTEKMVQALNRAEDIEPYLYNDLENAVFDDYIELKKIKEVYPKSIMTGSGSAYFVLDNISESKLSGDYEFINNITFIDNGVSLC